LKPVQLMNVEIEVAASGKVPNGITEFPFEFDLVPAPEQELHDTYHGVYVNVQYSLTCDITRSMLNRNLKKTKEFIVEQKPDKERKAVEQKAKPFQFKVSPESLQNVKDSSKSRIPKFLFEGSLERTTCSIYHPFTGELVIKQCDVDIKSIELQLVRVESCTYMEGEAREATEIQNIQIADGNVVRGLAIPIHMVFPRLFTCSTTISKAFKVEFEVNLIILFADSHMVTENFPIKIYR